MVINENHSLNVKIVDSVRKVDTMAKCYLLITLVVYIIMCFFMGHPFWILSVFLQNMVSDLTGETPRMLATEYFVVFEASVWMETETGAVLCNTVLAVLPEVVEFTCIDAVISKLIRKKNFLTKIYLFFGGYVLQALIAISLAEPVTREAFNNMVCSVLVAIFVSTVVIGAVISVIYSYFCFGYYDLEDITNNLRNVLMSFVYVIIGEGLKILVVIFLFHLTVILFHEISILNNTAVLFSRVSIFAPVYFVILNRYFDEISGWVSKRIVGIAVVEAGGNLETSIIGDMYCMVIAVSMLVCGFILYFQLS